MGSEYVCPGKGVVLKMMLRISKVAERSRHSMTDIPKSVPGTVLIVLGCAVADNIGSTPGEQWFKGDTLRM